MFGLGIPELIVLLVIFGVPVAIIIAVVRRKKAPSLPPGVAVTVNASTPERRTNVTDEIERLHALKEKGALTDEEFAEQKRKLLGS